MYSTAQAPAATAATLAPELSAWLGDQMERGHTVEQILQAIVVAGWDPAVAAQALQPTASEMAPLQVPQLAPPVSGGMVDAGDKWVEVTYLLVEPNVVVFSSLLGDAECQAMIDAARPRLSRSLTVDTQTGGEELHPDRTSQGMFFERGEDDVIQRVEARIARLFNWPVEHGEPLQVLRYPPGSEYKPHYDYFDPGAPGTPAVLQRGGQRVATLVMYLHEPGDGG
ncbi:MAG: 2-oxoglutarate-dependent dioxygenase, partial [Polaromonas sp.]|nr:2-oxoglutarate-dependent dioxygenase [Polaromonas sp.]